MENIVIQTLGEISTVLIDTGVEMDTWRSDAIQKILVIAINRAFQVGRSEGLNQVMELFDPGGKDD